MPDYQIGSRKSPTNKEDDIANVEEDTTDIPETRINNQIERVGRSIESISDNLKKDPLSASYKLYTGREAERFFIKGRAFAMIWHENAARSANANATEPSVPLDKPFNRLTVSPDGVTIFSHIRRFVIVKTNWSRRFCLAIPVSTYRGTGLTGKRMSVLEKQAHAILYDQRRRPYLLPGEFEMDKEPIAIEMATGEELSPSSRLNFSSVQTIEWNVRVKNVGRVSASASLRRLELYFKQELLDDDEEDPRKNSKQSIPGFSGVNHTTKVPPQDNMLPWSINDTSVSERSLDFYGSDRTDKQIRLAESTRPLNFEDDPFSFSHLFTSEGQPIDPTGSIPYTSTSTNTNNDTRVGLNLTLHNIKSPLSKSTKKGFGNHENHDYLMSHGQHKYIEEHKAIRGKGEALDGVQDLHRNFVPTDSGYASLLHPKRASGSDYKTRLGGTEIGHDEFSDTATLYSQASTIPTIGSKSLIDEFAETLCNDLGAGQLEVKASDTLFGDMSEVFADFALRLGQESPSIEARQAMLFIYQRQRYVRVLYWLNRTRWLSDQI